MNLSIIDQQNRTEDDNVSVHTEDDNKLDRSRYEIENTDPPTTLSSNHQKGDDDIISDSEIRSGEEQKFTSFGAGADGIPYKKGVY